MIKKDLVILKEVETYNQLYEKFTSTVTLTDDYKFATSIKTKGSKEAEFFIVSDLIYPSKWFKDEKTGLVKFEITYKVRNKFYKKILNEVKKSDLTNILSQLGFVLKDNRYEVESEFRKHFYDMLSFLVENYDPNFLVSQLGYQENGGFAYGEMFIEKDGSISQCDTTDDLIKLREQFIPKGDKMEYFKIVNNFFQLKDFSKQKIYALCLLSTPILSVVDVDGSFINLKSQDSGLGKSLTQKFAQLFYRNKSKLDNDFSRLSILNECGLIKSYPVILEEISTAIKEDPKSIRQLIHNITGGSDKKRLDKNAKQKDTMSFNLNLGGSSNPCIFSTVPADSIAELVRVLQIDLSIKNDESLSVLFKMINKMKSNCAHGYFFISKMLENSEQIKEVYEGEYDYIIKNLFKDTKFRYIAATLACASTFAKLMEIYGFKLDRKEIDETIKNIVDETLEVFDSYKIDDKKIIGDLLNKLVLNHYNYKVGGNYYLNENEQYNSRNDGIILNKNKLIIPKSIFESKVCMGADRRHSSLFNLTMKDLIDELNKKDEYAEVKQMTYLGSRVVCVSIDLLKSGFSDKILQAVSSNQVKNFNDKDTDEDNPFVKVN